MDIHLCPRPTAFAGLTVITATLVFAPKVCADDVPACLQAAEDVATNEGFVTISTTSNDGGTAVQF